MHHRRHASGLEKYYGKFKKKYSYCFSDQRCAESLLQHRLKIDVTHECRLSIQPHNMVVPPNLDIEKSEIDALCELFHGLDGTFTRYSLPYLTVVGPNWKRKDGWLQFEKTRESNKCGTSLLWFGTAWEKGHLVSLDLQGNNLRGHIPEHVFRRFKKLRILKLSQNPHLTGDVDEILRYHP